MTWTRRDLESIDETIGREYVRIEAARPCLCGGEGCETARRKRFVDAALEAARDLDEYEQAGRGIGARP
jgi:hypothetical protein